MIIYNLRNPIDTDSTICVGVTGENKTYTQEFFINDMTDSSYSYSIHLRFADGSVNTVIPDEVIVNGDGTKIKWLVKQTDIFTHGFFEVQLEGRNDDGEIFETHIVTLYADESIPIEDVEFDNPNSETIKLREEAYEFLGELKLQQDKLDQNMNLLLQTDITKKANKATTLAGYGIKDAYTSSKTNSLLLGKEDISNKISDEESITDEANNYPSVEYLREYFYNAFETDVLLDEKADCAETLSGYGITDAMTADEIETRLGDKLDSSEFENGVCEMSFDETYPISSIGCKYQKFGKYVTIQFTFNTKAAITEPINIQFTNIPFRNDSQVSGVCVSSTTRTVCPALISSYSNNLTVLLQAGIKNGERIATSLTYKIY